MKQSLIFLKNNWPVFILLLIVLVATFLNFKPGRLIIGNDNFSPELNPQLTLTRSFANPAWRSYRVLGIPSDSEHADWWRAILYTALSPLVPSWVISQGYIFLTLLISVISISKLTGTLTRSRLAQFLAGFIYLTSLLTLWVYSFPVHLFVAAYAFTPLVLWRLFCSLKNPTHLNKLFLLLTSIMLGTAALTATMFLVLTGLIFYLGLAYTHSLKSQFKQLIASLLLLLLPHLFWLPTFALYVQTNRDALQNSAINREITSTTIQSEHTINTPDNVIRFAGAWLDTKENGTEFTYPYHDFYRTNPLGINLGYLVPTLALIGAILAFSKLRKAPFFSYLIPLPIVGLILIKGTNPPFNAPYLWLDQNIPLFHQVFRWGSSKFWPLLAIPLPLLVSFIFTQIRSRTVKAFLAFTTTIALFIYSTPIWQGQLIRPDVYLTLPAEYNSLNNELSDHKGRLATTPNTNTRYFRKHDWGFWGSVFLNYLLENPTTEKALIIGSNENEQAFTVLDHLYYSASPPAYSNALARYQIPNVLSDHSVTNNGLNDSYSFAYDWDLHAKQVTTNPNLEHIWQDNFLSLYQANTDLNNTSTAYSSHNYQSLNSILALTDSPVSYHYQAGGTILPLALSFNQLENSSNYLNLSSIYQGPDTNYSFIFPDLNEYLLNFSNDTLTLSPYFPQLTINNQPAYKLPTSSFSVSDTTTAITINDEFYPLPTQLTLPLQSEYQVNTWETETTKSPKLGRVRLTNCMGDGGGDGSINSLDPIRAHINSRSCLIADTDTGNDNYFTTKFTLTSSQPSIIKVCLHSYLLNRCVNDPLSVTTSPVPTDLTLPIVTFLPNGDNLAIFLTITPHKDAAEITLDNFTLTSYKKSDNLSLTPPPTSTASHNQTLMLTSGDKITMSFPILTNYTNFPTSPLIPFRANCNDRSATNNLSFENHPDQSITLTTNNCFDGLYQPLLHLTPNINPLLLIAGNASHEQGIPLELNLKTENSKRRVFSDLFREQDHANLISLLPLPQDETDFTLELLNRGIGVNDSVNTLNSLVTIPIPKSWLKWQLTPQRAEEPVISRELSPLTRVDSGIYIAKLAPTQTLITIPQATSRYWKAAVVLKKPTFLTAYLSVISGEKLTQSTTVNGWQQGWLTDSQQEGWVVVTYLPNLISYLGLLSGIVAAILLILRRDNST